MKQQDCCNNEKLTEVEMVSIDPTAGN